MASNRCFRRWSKRLPSVFEAFRSSSARLSCCSWTCWCMLMPYLAISCHVDMKRKQMKTMTRIDKASIHKFSHTHKVRPDGVIHLRVLSMSPVRSWLEDWPNSSLKQQKSDEISIKSKPTAVILMLFSGFTLLIQHSHPLAQSTPPCFCWEYHNRKILCWGRKNAGSGGVYTNPIRSS